MKYLLLILLFLSCSLHDNNIKPNDGLSNITYYANTHTTNHGYVTYPMNSWSKTIVFNNSAKYVTSDPLNQDDWNKLFGVRKNAISNYRNGAYLVWCWPNKPIGDVNYNKIRLGWYLHNDNGDFVSMPLSQSIYVNLYTPVYLSVQNFNDRFVFIIAGQYFTIYKSQYNVDNFTNGWRLSPHFGGQETTDHNILINYN